MGAVFHGRSVRETAEISPLVERPKAARFMWAAFGFFAWSLVALPAARAHDLRADSRPAALQEVAFDQRVNEQVPLDLVFRDETGSPVRLGQYFDSRPVILVLVYYHCRDLCPLLLDGVVRTLRGISLGSGDQYHLLVVSFDPRDTPRIAAAKKTDLAHQYGRAGTATGWHFLTGEEATIQSLTRAVGFHYTYDAATEQFGHAAGLVVLSPHGRIYRYMYGIDFSPRDLRLSLVEASGNKIGSVIDQVLLFCYHYDPATGKYSLLILKVVRLAGLATVGGLAAFIITMWRRDRRRTIETAGGAPRHVA